MEGVVERSRGGGASCAPERSTIRPHFKKEGRLAKNFDIEARPPCRKSRRSNKAKRREGGVPTLGGRAREETAVANRMHGGEKTEKKNGGGERVREGNPGGDRIELQGGKGESQGIYKKVGKDKQQKGGRKRYRLHYSSSFRGSPPQRTLPFPGGKSLRTLTA